MRPDLRSRSRSSVVLYSLTVATSFKYLSAKFAWVVETWTPIVLPLSAAWTALIAASPAAASLLMLTTLPGPSALATGLSFAAMKAAGGRA